MANSKLSKVESQTLNRGLSLANDALKQFIYLKSSYPELEEKILKFEKNLRELEKELNRDEKTNTSCESLLKLELSFFLIN